MEDMDQTENTPLLVVNTSNIEERRGERKHSMLCVLLFVCGVTALSASVIICYFLYFKNVIGLKVLALNCWGMPQRSGSEDKELRIKAIGEMIQRQEFDVYLLSELWMRPDHQTIKSLLPEGYYMTEVGDFAPSTCDGRVLPTFCSGLATVSRFPFMEKQFLEFSVHGNPFKTDGEYWARKGAGRVRIKPYNGFVVDLLVTHTCATGPSYSNAYYREKQIKELVGHVQKSNADFIILGGDFNTDPKDKETSYHTLKEAMVNSMEEFFIKIKEWLCPKRSTYGNPENCYSNMYAPVLYDYIWHKGNGKNMIWTNFFKVPFLTTIKDKEDTISVSDHEAVTANLLLWKYVL